MRRQEGRRQGMKNRTMNGQRHRRSVSLPGVRPASFTRRKENHVWHALAVVSPAGDPGQRGRELAAHPRPAHPELCRGFPDHPARILPRGHAPAGAGRLLDHGPGHGTGLLHLHCPARVRTRPRGPLPRDAHQRHHPLSVRRGFRTRRRAHLRRDRVPHGRGGPPRQCRPGRCFLGRGRGGLPGRLAASRRDRPRLPGHDQRHGADLQHGPRLPARRRPRAAFDPVGRHRQRAAGDALGFCRRPGLRLGSDRLGRAAVLLPQLGGRDLERR